MVPHQTGQLLSVALVSVPERGTKSGSVDISGMLWLTEEEGRSPEQPLSAFGPCWTMV